MTILAGGFNTENFSCGRTNNSGKALIDFYSIDHPFIMKSAFKHPTRHITTC